MGRNRLFLLQSRTGEGRKLRVKAGPPKSVRLSIERNLDKSRKETGRAEIGT